MDFSKPVELSQAQKDWAMKMRDVHIEGPGWNQDIGSASNLYIGYLGEAAFFKRAKSREEQIDRVDQSSHDFIYKGIQVDVKTWPSKYDPQVGYDVLISKNDSNRGQGVYVFGCCNTMKGHIIFVGWKDCDEFRSDSVLWLKGVSPPGRDFSYKADTKVMGIKDLNPISEL